MSLLINEVEKIARVWNTTHSSYPITTLDFSLQNGGYFYRHDGHKNGLDADIMYIGTGTYQYGIFVLTTAGNYDRASSQQLIQMFDALPSVVRIWTSDNVIANISTSDKIEYLSGHIDHFHVDSSDPDGNLNQTCP